jgi:NAD(P)-dependent dehydrogenase (short-subunit alcohol dehydrogenase family)
LYELTLQAASRLVYSAISSHGRLEFAYNNARIELSASIEAISHDGFRRVFDIVAAMKHEVVAMLRARRRWCDRDTSSIAESPRHVPAVGPIRVDNRHLTRGRWRLDRKVRREPDYRDHNCI